MNPLAANTMIAKIPEPLSRHIARTFNPCPSAAKSYTPTAFPTTK